jgi:chemotaxis response regulator CheB
MDCAISFLTPLVAEKRSARRPTNMQMSTPIKVLLADDSHVARRAIRRLLAQYPKIELVGEAVSFAQLIQMTNDLKPQVVLMDLHMKDQATVRIEDMKTQLNGLIVAMSLANDGETKALADKCGAVTLLDKTELVDDLIPTIEKFASPN